MQIRSGSEEDIECPSLRNTSSSKLTSEEGFTGEFIALGFKVTSGEGFTTGGFTV